MWIVLIILIVLDALGIVAVCISTLGDNDERTNILGGFLMLSIVASWLVGCYIASSYHKHDMKSETHRINNSTNLYVVICGRCDSTFFETTDKETYADFMLEQSKLK